MNTYSKFYSNVYLAKCTEKHEKGSIIKVTTKHGKENESVIFNFIKEENNFFYYSIIRADGWNIQERARKKAEKLQGYATTAQKKSDQYWKASQEGKDFLVLAEPIKIGHHSENKHRKLINRNWQRMKNCVEFSDKCANYLERSEYWEKQTEKINLSMPESLYFYAFKIEKTLKLHEELKNGTIQREHSYSLAYIKKSLNEAQKLYKIALKLWGE
jgi:hypothetical protein